MEETFPDAMVPTGPDSEFRTRLPDPKDSHVLAAAVRSRADMIVTLNHKHFPPAILKPYGIRTIGPDEFVQDLIGLFPEAAIETARLHRERLKHPPMDRRQYLNALRNSGLKGTAEVLSQRGSSI